MSRAPTIKDVAQRADCGIATVSRVLNGRGSTSAKTREKVLAAATDLGFEFNALGRSLQSSSTRTIGCLVPSLINPVFAEVVQAAQNEALQAGYQLILACSDYDEERETQAIQTLLAKQVDGLIVTVNNARTSPGLEMIRRRNVPCCLVYNHPVAGFAAWSVDNHGAAAAAAGEFVRLGHRHMGFLALRFHRSDRSQERYEGFLAACEALGVRRPVLLEIEEEEGDLLKLLGALLNDNQRLTGIFASNDYLALAAMKAATSLGKKVPDDISIIGFDGIKSGLMVDPNLATIATDPAALGKGAAATVLAHLTENEPPPRPNPSQTFRFRSGGSISPPAAGQPDDGEAATSPSSHSNPKASKILQEQPS